MFMGRPPARGFCRGIDAQPMKLMKSMQQMQPMWPVEEALRYIFLQNQMNWDKYRADPIPTWDKIDLAGALHPPQRPRVFPGGGGAAAANYESNSPSTTESTKISVPQLNRLTESNLPLRKCLWFCSQASTSPCINLCILEIGFGRCLEYLSFIK